MHARYTSDMTQTSTFLLPTDERFMDDNEAMILGAEDVEAYLSLPEVQAEIEAEIRAGYAAVAFTDDMTLAHTENCEANVALGFADGCTCPADRFVFEQ